MSRDFKKEHGELRFNIPPNIADKEIQQVRIHPRDNAHFFEIEYIYDQPEMKADVDPDKFLGVDFGLDNLATCVTSEGASFIIDGKQIKSYNRLYNRENARLQSIKDKQKIKGFTARQYRNLRKRNARINHAMSVAARRIIAYCINHRIGNIIVGYNPDWKREIHIGTQNNQNFVQIPHGKLHEKLAYLCELYGIRYVEQEESYTSKASFFMKGDYPMKRKYFTVAILICAGLLSLYMREAEEFTRTGQAMNTIIRMTIHGHDESVLDEAFTLLNELDFSLSMYNPSSDISRANSLASLNVKHTTIEAINDAVRLYNLTGGVFNPLIGAVTGLWKINRKEGTIPTPESLDYAVKLADINNLTISGDNISLRQKGCVLDLGGIAKGYASVKIADLLRNKGVKSAIIDLGGNVYAVGSKVDGSKWRIGIRNPLDPYGAPAVVVDVADCAVITSGNYERYKTIDGKKYSHFFDPSTGKSIMSDLLSVTVITSDGSLADGLATAFMITGVERAFEILKGIEPAPGVVFISQSGITATSNLRGIITKSAGAVNFRGD